MTSLNKYLGNPCLPHHTKHDRALNHLISVVNLSSAVCVNDHDNKLPVIHGVNDPIISDAQPEQVSVPLELFNVLAVWQSLDCCDNTLFLIER